MANEIVATSEENKVTQDLLLDYLKTMNKGLNEQQKKQFLAVAGTFGLNPWKREVYAVTFKNKDGSTDMSIVTGYETYIKRAELNPNYDGFEIEFKGSFKRGKVTKSGKTGSWQVDALVPDGEVSCICTVYRKDRAHPTREEVFFDEYNKGNDMWISKPRTMLKKVAIVSAFRKAFPFDFGGMPYTNDELPDHMTGADKLDAQGMQEVTQDAPKKDVNTLTAPLFDAPAKDEEYEKWKAGMVGLAKQNEMAYKKGMADAGFKDLDSVPPEMRGRVFNHVQSFVSAYAMANNAAAKSAPTANEQNDRDF